MAQKWGKLAFPPQPLRQAPFKNSSVHHLLVQMGKLSSRRPEEGNLPKVTKRERTGTPSPAPPSGTPHYRGEQKPARHECPGVCKVWQKPSPCPTQSLGETQLRPGLWLCCPLVVTGFSLQLQIPGLAVGLSRDGTMGTSRIWGDERPGRGEMVRGSQKRHPSPHTHTWKEMLEGDPGRAQKPISVGSGTQGSSPTAVDYKWQQVLGSPATQRRNLFLSP